MKNNRPLDKSKKTNIKCEHCDFWQIHGFPATKEKKLDDYCDKRKSTDLTRFNYCPICGKKIDWKTIKGGANG